MNLAGECIETGGTIISLQDYQPESERSGSKETFQAMAVEKIAEELKTFHMCLLVSDYTLSV